MVVNDGKLWIDNIHLILSRMRVNPLLDLAFIHLGMPESSERGPGVDFYATNVTFQAEGRRWATAVQVNMPRMSAYLEGVLNSSHSVGLRMLCWEFI